MISGFYLYVLTVIQQLAKKFMTRHMVINHLRQNVL